MHRLVALIAVVAALAASPAAALAQDNPFLPDAGQQAPQVDSPPPPAPVEERSSDDGDLGTGVAIAVAAIVVLVIAGIWYAITRDARQAAPSRARPHTARSEPDADARATPGARGRHPARAARGRKLSRQEQKRRKRGRAR